MLGVSKSWNGNGRIGTVNMYNEGVFVDCRNGVADARRDGGSDIAGGMSDDGFGDFG